MRLMYMKPKLHDLSQGSRIAYVRQFRHMSQDEVSNKLGVTGECKRRTMNMNDLIENKINTIDSIVKNTEILEIEYGLNINNKKLIKRIKGV